MSWFVVPYIGHLGRNNMEASLVMFLGILTPALQAIVKVESEDLDVFLPLMTSPL